MRRRPDLEPTVAALPTMRLRYRVVRGMLIVSRAFAGVEGEGKIVDVSSNLNVLCSC